MRRFQHNPDLVWIERRFTFERDGIEDVTATVERSGRGAGRLLVFDTAVDTALDAVGYGWAANQPVDVLRPWLLQASRWAAEAIERGRELDGRLAERWLAVALLAGDWTLAETIASLVPDSVADLAKRDPMARTYLLALSRLVAGDSNAARAAAEAMAQAAKDPRSSPAVAESYEGLGALAAAVAASDQAAFDDAIRERTETLARQYGRSVEGRRHPDGLLDLRGSALAAVAHREGLQLPPENAHVAAELIEAAG